MSAIVVFINGSINSGKTTVSKLLKEKIPYTAHIEIDDLRAMVDWMPLAESIPLNLQNALSITKNFIERNINIILSYPLNKDEYEFFNHNLPEETEKFFFTLSPELETALSNRGSRDLTEWEVERIKYHYQTGINKPDFGIIIDNTLHTPQETADEILYYIESRDIRRNKED